MCIRDRNCAYLDESGKSQIMEMGCYGIGVSRIVGAAIEQGNDAKGIVLPAAIAPFAIDVYKRQGPTCKILGLY